MLISVLRRVTLALLAVIVGEGNGLAGSIQEAPVSPTPGASGRVSFFYRFPEKLHAGKEPQGSVGLLLLVPGFNGDGRMFLSQEAWTRFADQQRVVLVSPSFHTTPDEIREGRGYYYPALGSGGETLAAIQQIAGKEKFTVGRILIFGFSAGAHFAHRFALWNRERPR